MSHRASLLKGFASLSALMLLVACTPDKSIDPEESAALILPVAQVKREIVKQAPGSREGEAIYNGACKACHDSGVSGSPKFADAAAWAPRIAQGYDALVKTAQTGKGAMPAKGGVSDLTEDELKRVVAYMANKAGANFTAPEVKK